MGFNINFVLLLWFGIYLHLVTANKNLTNLLKAMLSLNPYYWSALHTTWTPTFSEFMHIIPHNLLSDEHMWAHPFCLTPHRSRTGTTGWGAWRMLWCVRERSRSSSSSQLWVAGSLSPFDVLIYLFCIEILLYSKDVTFVSVPSFIICETWSQHTWWLRSRPGP
jgi:hypothetical protein